MCPFYSLPLAGVEVDRGVFGAREGARGDHGQAAPRIAADQGRGEEPRGTNIFPTAVYFMDCTLFFFFVLLVFVVVHRFWSFLPQHSCFSWSFEQRGVEQRGELCTRVPSFAVQVEAFCGCCVEIRLSHARNNSRRCRVHRGNESLSSLIAKPPSTLAAVLTSVDLDVQHVEFISTQPL